MNKLYSYIGPKEIRERVSLDIPGKIILSQRDVIDWIASTDQKIDKNNSVTATYVINDQYFLLISDRHDEHVACAGGKSVFSAGEITFEIIHDKVKISQITNQSTGYCPEPSSWPSVDKALSRTDLKYPAAFTSEFKFRRCLNCQTINIIKEEFFFCAVCDSQLPSDYNIG
jgi:hypothetical protein